MGARRDGAAGSLKAASLETGSQVRQRWCRYRRRILTVWEWLRAKSAVRRLTAALSVLRRSQNRAFPAKNYLKQHPDVDSGLHLTLTSGWSLYRWVPLAGKPKVPGLVDNEGCLWHSVQQVASHATPDEIETEIRAQLDRAEQLGIPIAHLDSHMGTLFARPDYFERFAKVGMEKGIPILAIGGHATFALKENPGAADKLRPWIPKIWNAGLPVIDDLHTDSYVWKPEEKTAKFIALLKELKPGVKEIIFHASIPTEDFPLITSSSPARLADTRALTDPTVRRLIQERGIIMTTWKELKERRKQAGAME